MKEKINELDGIIFFSIYQLPKNKKLRKGYLEYFIKKKKKLFFAFEDLKVKSIKDINEIELIFSISKKTTKLNSTSAKF